MSYTPPAIQGVATHVGSIHALDQLGAVKQWAQPASAAYPLANLAIYVPFSVSEVETVTEAWVHTGATAGGNWDIGIYDAAGARLTSTGSVARTVSVVDNSTTLTDVTLIPGVRYYMAFAGNGTNNYVAGTHAAGLYEACGVLESTTSFVLPSSPTLSRTTRAYVPHFGLNLGSVAF